MRKTQSYCSFYFGQSLLKVLFLILIFIMFRTPILGYPLKAIRWFREDIYKNSPEKRREAETAIKKFYDANKESMEKRGVSEAVVCCDMRLVQIRNQAEPSELIPKCVYEEPS